MPPMPVPRLRTTIQDTRTGPTRRTKTTMTRVPSPWMSRDGVCHMIAQPLRHRNAEYSLPRDSPTTDQPTSAQPNHQITQKQNRLAGISRLRGDLAKSARSARNHRREGRKCSIVTFLQNTSARGRANCTTVRPVAWRTSYSTLLGTLAWEDRKINIL